MNKAELIDVLTEKMGSDRRTATAAVENVVDIIVRAVHKGQSVTITGFGVFEQRRRAARVARNPRTGETVRVEPTSIPAFRPGAQFKAVISGVQELPDSGPAVKRGVVPPIAVHRPAPEAASAPDKPARKRVSAKTAAEPKPAQVAKSSAKTAVKAAPAKATKTAKAAKPAAKSETKAAAKPAAKAAVKPAAKAAAKPAAKAAVKAADKGTAKKKAPVKRAGKK